LTLIVGACEAQSDKKSVQMATCAAASIAAETDEREWRPSEESSYAPDKVRIVSSNASSSDRQSKLEMLAHVKLSLSTAAATRFALSPCWWTVILPVALIMPAMAEVKRFANSFKGVSNHKRGSPHCHALRTVLQTIK
jgi:hypothetical protein